MINALITTKKAPFSGIIIPIENICIPGVVEYIKNTNRNVYIAKHCENTNRPTHLVKYGIVNRYGWFLTNETLFSENSPSTKSIDFEKGWFRKINLNNIKDIDKLIF